MDRYRERERSSEKKRKKEIYIYIYIDINAGELVPAPLLGGLESFLPYHQRVSSYHLFRRHSALQKWDFEEFCFNLGAN